MSRFYLLAAWLWAGVPLWAQAAAAHDPAPAHESGAALDQPAGEDEAEQTGILPPNSSVLASTQPVTPVTEFPEKKIYDQALEELARAQELWTKGEAETASDMALEAYDDLNSIHRFRGRKRKKLRRERRQAATVYVQGGIAFIGGFVKKAGATPQAAAEGRSRLEDLRDVARDYPELNQDLNRAIQYCVPTAS